MKTKRRAYHDFKKLAAAYHQEDALWEQYPFPNASEISALQEGYGGGEELTPEDRENESNIATAHDIAERMMYQDARFIALQAADELTPPWKAYGMKRSTEINVLMGKMKKES